MYRLAALTLIPLCLIGAVLPRAHSHAAVGPSDAGQSRAHVHLSGGHDHVHVHGHVHDGEHHDHSHHAESQGSANDVPPRGSFFSRPEHHQDAIYLTDVLSSGRIGTPKKVAVLSLVPLVVERAAELPALARSRSSGGRASGPPSLFEPLPIYLAHASLRL